MDEDSAVAFAQTALAESNLPPEVTALVGVGISTLDPSRIAELIEDAVRARALFDQGDPTSAKEIIAKYRPVAEEMGLGPMFDEMFSSFEDSES